MPVLEVLPARPLAALGARVRIGALHPGGLVAGGTEAGSVLVAETAGKPRVFGAPRLHEGPVAGLQFSSDGKHLLSAGGKLSVWWDVRTGAPARTVKGPQVITAALLHEVGSEAEAYLGTAFGAMVHWRVRDKAARPLRELACPALPVQPARRGLAEAERCPFGSFVEAEDGSGAACVYPVTALALVGQTLWRACREGSLHGQQLDRGSRQGFGVGHLRAMAARIDGLLLLARDDGELRLFDPGRGRAAGELEPGGTAQLAASDGELLAVALGREINIYVGRGGQPSARLSAAATVVGLALHASPAEVRYLTLDGHAEARALRRRR